MPDAFLEKVLARGGTLLFPELCIHLLHADYIGQPFREALSLWLSIRLLLSLDEGHWVDLHALLDLPPHVLHLVEAERLGEIGPDLHDSRLHHAVGEASLMKPATHLEHLLGWCPLGHLPEA